MANKRMDAPADAPPPGAGGNDYRKRAGKIGITVNVTPEERDALRVAAAVAKQSMASYVLAAALERMKREGSGEAAERPKGRRKKRET